MDEDFTQVSVGASRTHLLIADYFMNETPSEYATIVAETKVGSRNDPLWVVGLQEETLTTYIYNDIGYWVRPAQLLAREHGIFPGTYVRCHVGFSPESGKFLKLMARRAHGSLSVWMESEPVTHVLDITHRH